MAVNVLLRLLIPLTEQINNSSERLTFSTDLYDISVPENESPINLLTLQTQAKVLSSADSQPVTYAILQGDMNGTFTLDRSTGKLSLLAPLDYEQGNQYELLVSATLGPDRAFSMVKVRVQDVNEHTPKFQRPSYETQVTEGDGRELPKKILQVLATDQDGSSKGKLVYSLHGESVSDVPLNVSSWNRASLAGANFAMDYSSGDIYLLKALDRDAPTGQAHWKLIVGVSDGLRTARAPLLINVKDINDNAPFFPHQVVKASVTENGPQGYEVAHVEALDLDDPAEGSNTALTFSLQKNVIDESSGEPIFDIESKTGRITTALCCLDREKTAAYTIQVVATDGGGLKGTGTVYIQVEDENDNQAEFLEPSWEFFISESTLVNQSFATLKINDPDLDNSFFFKVIPGSGNGWDRFLVVPDTSNTGVLILLKPLDYEDPEQLQGFRFIVQLTDKCGEDWDDPVHWASAWVHIYLLDENDHAPVFPEPHVSLDVPEDTPPGVILIRLTATDADDRENGRIFYSLEQSSNSLNMFTIDTDNQIQLQRPLDRETQAVHILEVIATDNGQPPRSGTSLFTVNVTDINDNPPFIRSPVQTMLPENASPRIVAEILFSDKDDWLKGHGPPFEVAMDTTASWETTKSFEIASNPNGDGGKGSATLRSLLPLDREEEKVRLIPLLVRDAGGMSATVTLPVIIGDINDNPMAPGVKEIKVFRPKNAHGRIQLGRVFVDDPDDWDAEDKLWAWEHGQNYRIFALDAQTGMLSTDADSLNHRYQLRFSVSDQTHHQINVPAVVDIAMETLDIDVNSYQIALPIHIASHSPMQLILPDKGISPIEAVIEEISRVTEDTLTLLALSTGPKAANPETYRREKVVKQSHVLSTLWVKPRYKKYFRHLGFRKKVEIFKKTNVRIKAFGPPLCIQFKGANSRHGTTPIYSSSVTDANSTGLVTPIVEQIKRCNCRNKNGYSQPSVNKGQSQPLQMRTYANVLQTCDPNPCLNEGRCLLTEHGPKCICPSGTDPVTCKQRSRRFRKGGWIQVESTPSSCSNLHFSIQFRTKAPDGVLIYVESESEEYFKSSGQIHSHLRNLFLLELVNSRPRLTTRIGKREVVLELPVHSSTLHELPLAEEPFSLNGPRRHLADPGICLSDGLWHRIDIFWASKNIHLQVVDMCPILPDKCHASCPILTASHDSLNASTPNVFLLGDYPLYIGGLPTGDDEEEGEKYRIYKSRSTFQGCVHNLRINNEIVDLGQDIFENRTSPGCGNEAWNHEINKQNCFLDTNRCIRRTLPISCPCAYSEIAEDQCSETMSPSTLNSQSRVIVSPTFTVPKLMTSFHLRFRTWNPSGRLLLLIPDNSGSRMSLYLMDGHLCFLNILKHASTPLEEYFVTLNFTLCLLEATLNDGQWHSAKFYKNSHLAELSADGADWPFYNSTLLHQPLVASSSSDSNGVVTSTGSPSSNPPTKSSSIKGRPLALKHPKIEVHIGGITDYPAYKEGGRSQHPFDGCVDAIYVWDHYIPLPLPRHNRDWAQFTDSKNGVKSGCSNHSICLNVSCPKPLKCVEIWRRHKCSCGDGKVLSEDGNTCVDINECLWKPCLKGGTCINEDSTYSCLCPAHVSGKNCEVMSNDNSTDTLSLGLVIGAVICSCLIILFLFGFVLFIQHRRRRKRRSLEELHKGSYTEQSTSCFIEKMVQCDRRVSETTNQKAVKQEECLLGLDVLRINAELQHPLPPEKRCSRLTFNWTSSFQTKANEELPMASTESHQTSYHMGEKNLHCTLRRSLSEKTQRGEDAHPGYEKQLVVYDPGILSEPEYSHSASYVNKLYP